VTPPYEPTPPPTVPPPPPSAPPGRSVAGQGAAGAPPPGGPQVAGPSALPEEVPDLDDRRRELHPKIVTVWRFSTVVSLLPPILVLSAVAVGFLGAPGWVVPAVLLVLLGVFAAWYPGARYARWRWRFTDLAVELEHGVLVRQAEALPYFRIQQIDVNEGPIDRLLGLASLQVTSASASGSVTLPGIAAEDAHGLRRALLARAAAAVGEQGTGVRDAV
jgi:uncharacterized protein